jgi:Subtilase family
MSKISLNIFFFLSINIHFLVAQNVSTESNVAELELSLNKINLIHRYFPLLHGEGFTINVKENKIDTTDIDFKGRYLKNVLSSNFISNHAADMATILAGAGNANFAKKGVAWKANIVSTSFANLLPEADNFYKTNKISVENHSYGTDIQNQYTNNAVAYDASANRLVDLLHIFSAGNSGSETPKDGRYRGLANYSTLTGGFKQAKNTLIIGAVDSLGKLENKSSRGPTFDGRLKPDLVAFGQDGSSGAAALVSGVSTLLQQQYANQRNGVRPSASLVKALLLNSAEDVGNQGIDYQSGYGNLNAFRALQTLNEGKFFQKEIINSEIQTFTMAVPSNVKTLKITLVWNDPAAKESATSALINDLDLSIITPNGTRFLPWVLSNFPNVDSLKKLPVRKRDGINNAEQITLENPAGGTYSIIVSGFKIQGKQAYSVAYQWELLDEFQWQFPLDQDNLKPNETNLVRWKSTFKDTKGILEYAPYNGKNWVRVGEVDLSKGSFRWKTPNLFYSPSRLRMSVANKAFVSDTFSVSKPLEITLGYNCKDSLLLFWNTPEFVNKYVLYQLGTKYFEPIVQTNRRAVVVAKNKFKSDYFAVAPVLDNDKMGIRSNAINVNNQGVGCFLRAFLVDIVNENTANLRLDLSTLQGINYIAFQQFEGTDFQDILRFLPNNKLNYSFQKLLVQGENSFRTKVVFQNNSIGYSNIETVFYFGEKNQFIHYPNPLKSGDLLTIKVKNPNNSVWQLYSMKGDLLITKTLDSETITQEINLPIGKYIYRIMENNQLIDAGKLMVE